MNLLALRNEVLNHGFDPIIFGPRVNQYLNDAQSYIARRVEFFTDEATMDFSTVSGTPTYSQPADMATSRALRDTGRSVEMMEVGLRTIDRSSPRQGAPQYYALDGLNIRLYPTPDNIYPLELRYWRMPSQLVNDTDTPAMPADWHRLLWYWAVKECYAAEDDMQTAGLWEQQFEKGLSEFSADAKFPSTDYPTQAKGWLGDEDGLSGSGWTAYF